MNFINVNKNNFKNVKIHVLPYEPVVLQNKGIIDHIIEILEIPGVIKDNHEKPANASMTA